MFKLAKSAVVVLGFSVSLVSFAAPIATVNGVPISEELANLFITEQTAQGAPDSPELRNAVREELIRRQLIVQEAKKSGLDKRADVAKQLEAAYQNQIVRAYVQEYAKKNPVTDAALKAEYDRVKAQMGNTEYKARHVLVKTEDEAKAIIAKLKGGEKFENVAKQSLDPGSKENGGDLGWSSANAFVKPFADALMALQKGKFTEAPVQSNFGFHVIMLEDTRPLAPPSFEEAKPQLLQQMQGAQIAQMIEALRAKAKVN